MATDRTNPNSWQSDSNRLKKFRESKDGPEIIPGKRRKKDTRRWCRGKVGQEHDYTMLAHSRWSRDEYKLACSRCHKVEDSLSSYDRRGNKIR